MSYQDNSQWNESVRQASQMLRSSDLHLLGRGFNERTRQPPISSHLASAGQSYQTPLGQLSMDSNYRLSNVPRRGGQSLAVDTSVRLQSDTPYSACPSLDTTLCSATTTSSGFSFPGPTTPDYSPIAYDARPHGILECETAQKSMHANFCFDLFLNANGDLDQPRAVEHGQFEADPSTAATTMNMNMGVPQMSSTWSPTRDTVATNSVNLNGPSYSGQSFVFNHSPLEFPEMLPTGITIATDTIDPSGCLSQSEDSLVNYGQPQAEHEATTGEGSQMLAKVATAKVIENAIQRRKHPAKYNCLKCGQSFTAQHNLSYHEVSHTGEKRYQCEYCKARFTTPRSKLRHMKNSCKGNTKSNSTSVSRLQVSVLDYCSV